MDTVSTPLEDVRKTFKVKWYRCPVDKAALRDLMQPSDLQGWFQAGGHLLIFVATGGLTLYLFSQQMWLGFALTLFVHGTSASFFKGIAAHELGHGSVFKTRWLNQFFLRLYSLISWHNHHEYAVSHTYHHRYTLHPVGDREVVLPQYSIFTPLHVLQVLTFNIVGGPMTSGMIPIIGGTIQTAFGGHGRSVVTEEWSRALYGVHTGERAKAVNWARLLLVFHGGVIVVAIATELWALPLVLTFQQFTANWLKLMVGMPMHGGLRSNVADFRKCVRTITLNPIAEFLYWRMNWHLEHHMYAAVPCYNLKKLHKLVAHDMPEPRTLFGAWREMAEVRRRQKDDPSYAFDTPVPTPGDAEAGNSDEIAASIGDIAPPALA
jgi:fatty acid desaturase